MADQVESKEWNFAPSRAPKVTLIRDPQGKPPSYKEIEVLVNPATLKETLQAEWSRMAVIGLDHEIPHYSRTKSIEFPLSFYVSTFEKVRQHALEAHNTRNTITDEVVAASMQFANDLRSLVFPSKITLRPPPVKVCWPGVLEIIGVVTSLSFEYKRFANDFTNSSGKQNELIPLIYQADVTFLETRASRRWSEDVASSGLQINYTVQPKATVPRVGKK